MGHTYISNIPDKDGIFNWTQEENETWEILITRQYGTIKNRTCEQFISALDTINIEKSKIPQHSELSRKLNELTGWETKAVPALIREDLFFSLLAKKIFPCTSFIRIPEELDYLEEPDIFHEFFGHIPLLSWRPYARFLERFGQFFINSHTKYHVLLTRIFWFTVEFGLIRTPHGMRIYGAGILSSHGETKRALEDLNVERVKYDALTCARTPYRYDIMQSKYFFIEDFEEIFSLFENNLEGILEKALFLGDINPTPSPAPVSP